MKLSDILQKDVGESQIIDPFLLKYNKYGIIKDQKVYQPFYCCKHGMSTFISDGDMGYTQINKKVMIVNTVLKCSVCNGDKNENESSCLCSYKIESKDFLKTNPEIILREKSVSCLNDCCIYDYSEYREDICILLQQADISYYNNLGIGCFIYLRYILEKIVYRLAKENKIDLKNSKGKDKTFRVLMDEVDQKTKIFPDEIKEEKYNLLFKPHSEFIHGRNDYDNDEIRLKYPSYRSLIVGVLDNINNKQNITKAKNKINE